MHVRDKIVGKDSNAVLGLARHDSHRILTTGEVVDLPNVLQNQAVPRDVVESIVATGDAEKFHRALGGLEPSRAAIESLACRRVAIGPSATRHSSTRRGGYRPAWEDITYCPGRKRRDSRREGRSTPPPALVRRNGRLVRPHHVFPPNDDRQVFKPTAWPFTMVGRIDVYQIIPNGPGQWPTLEFLSWGTGALVGRDTVLTAAHVLMWGGDWNVDTMLVAFTPAFYNGSSAKAPWLLSTAKFWTCYGIAKEYELAPGLKLGEAVKHGTAPAAWDMAALKLRAPLGTVCGYFDVADDWNDDWLDNAEHWLVGYPKTAVGQDLQGQQPTLQGGITFSGADRWGSAVELETDVADATGGNSGGPYFVWTDASDPSPMIVGVHVGEEWEFETQMFWFPVPILLPWVDLNNTASGGSALKYLVNVVDAMA